ncbi:MAG: hypothetical protein HFE78_05990 [Clostridiales bacterium]|nr:hypothetical protein [Clostridiales bacterium]
MSSFCFLLLIKKNLKNGRIEPSRTRAESDCPYYGRNIKTFINYFQIPRETFEEYYNSRWNSLHTIAPDKTVVELDAQFAGVDNFFTD